MQRGAHNFRPREFALAPLPSPPPFLESPSSFPLTGQLKKRTRKVSDGGSRTRRGGREGDRTSQIFNKLLSGKIGRDKEAAARHKRTEGEFISESE